jgi:PIN domain nuclease of toxin-antitoxin system
MQLLLDTCEFLWLATDDPKLPRKVADAVSDPTNVVYLSVVSFWEISVKHGLGKLELPESPRTFVPRMRSRHMILSLDLTEDTVARLTDLPALHRDPFDRMLICQAMARELTLASSDPLVRRYPIPVL